MSGRLALVEERVNAGFGLERFSGVGLGLGVERRLGSFTVGVRGQGATMQPDASGDLDRRLGDAELSATLAVKPWWGFYGGLTLRAIANDAGAQQWILGRIGVELHSSFTGEQFRAVGRLGMIPLTSVGGLSSSALAFDGAVGLDYERNRYVLGIRYALERFAFTSGTGTRRDEQLSTLTFRAGLKIN